MGLAYHTFFLPKTQEKRVEKHCESQRLGKIAGKIMFSKYGMDVELMNSMHLYLTTPDLHIVQHGSEKGS